MRLSRQRSRRQKPGRKPGRQVRQSRLAGYPVRRVVETEVIVNLIGSTRTRNGLTIQADVDASSRPKGARVTDDDLSKVTLTRASFHGDRNDSIAPNCST